VTQASESVQKAARVVEGGDATVEARALRGRRGGVGVVIVRASMEDVRRMSTVKRVREWETWEGDIVLRSVGRKLARWDAGPMVYIERDKSTIVWLTPCVTTFADN